MKWIVRREPKRVVPDYDAAQGYELAGFVWLQGWNDLVDRHAYPAQGKPSRYDLYIELLAHFIRDVRRDFDAPKMPFVIGVLGVGGAKADADTMEFRRAMAAPASLPEFKDNVFAVQTASFWSEELGAIDDEYAEVRLMRYFLDSKHKNYANADGGMTDEETRPSSFRRRRSHFGSAACPIAGYHYLGCAKTFALMGRAFAEPLLQRKSEQRAVYLRSEHPDGTGRDAPRCAVVQNPRTPTTASFARFHEIDPHLRSVVCVLMVCARGGGRYARDARLHEGGYDPAQR